MRIHVYMHVFLIYNTSDAKVEANNIHPALLSQYRPGFWFCSMIQVFNLFYGTTAFLGYDYLFKIGFECCVKQFEWKKKTKEKKKKKRSLSIFGFVGSANERFRIKNLEAEKFILMFFILGNFSTSRFCAHELSWAGLVYLQDCLQATKGKRALKREREREKEVFGS